MLALRDKSTYRNGASSHVPSSLVWFREPPPPRPYSSFESRHPGFFSYAAFYKNLFFHFPLRMKSPGGSTKRERKSKKGGISIVLVLTETSLSNFSF